MPTVVTYETFEVEYYTDFDSTVAWNNLKEGDLFKYKGTNTPYVVVGKSITKVGYKQKEGTSGWFRTITYRTLNPKDVKGQGDNQLFNRDAQAFFDKFEKVES